MKNVKDLDVTVTYKVGLGDVEMPEEVYEQLVKAAERGEEIDMAGLVYPEAREWLWSNIEERDCYDHRTGINDIS